MTIASAGFTAIAPRGQFTDTKTRLVSPLNANTYFAPSMYFATPLSPRGPWSASACSRRTASRPSGR